MVRYHRHVGVGARRWGKKRGALVFGYLAFLSTTRPIVLFSCSLSLFCCLFMLEIVCHCRCCRSIPILLFVSLQDYYYDATNDELCKSMKICMLSSAIVLKQQSISIIPHDANTVTDYSLVPPASSVSSFIWMWYVAGHEQDDMKWHPSSWRGATKHEDDDSESFLKQACLLLALEIRIKEDYHHLYLQE